MKVQSKKELRLKIIELEKQILEISEKNIELLRQNDFLSGSLDKIEKEVKEQQDLSNYR